MKPRYLVFILIIVLALTSTSANAQSGNYIKPYVTVKYTNFANVEESIYDRNKTVFEPTWHMGYGLNYIYNSTDIFGVEFGMIVEKTGQKYSGEIEDNINTSQTNDLTTYTSEIELSHIGVPILFNFNSRLEDEEVFLTISGGFKFNFLTNAVMATDPMDPIPYGARVNVMDLFNNTTVSFLTSAVFNIRLSDELFLNIGGNLCRTIGDIENKSFEFDRNIHLAEYYFPVSTKKENKPQTSTRKSTKDLNYSILVGFSYLFREIK